MAGGYSHDPSGIDGINRRLRQVERVLSEIRGSAGIKSAVVRGGVLVIENDDGELVARIGENTTGTNPTHAGVLFGGWDEWLMSAFQDSDTNVSYVNFGNGGAGGVWDLDNFQVFAETVRFGFSFPSAPQATAPPINSMNVSADEFIIVTPELGLYELPTTGSAANVHLGTVGSVWTLARVTSSRRYKTDIADAQIQASEVLALIPRTWIDKADAAAAGNMVPRDPTAPIDPDANDADADDLIPYVPPRQIGFIAEDVWEQETLRQFVGTNADGEPDSFDYERFASVALHAVCKAQQEQIDAQAAEIDDLKTKIAAMSDRLDALENRA